MQSYFFNSMIEVRQDNRMVFIDMARSLAILLMLEGHFIQLSIAPTTFSSESHWFVIWQSVRTITAPLFFMVSGIIFVVLLNKNPKLSIAKNARIKKGLKRAAQLILLGFALHLSIGQVDDYVQGRFSSWLFSIHALQCLGLGLIAMVLIYCCFKLIARGSLIIYYLTACLFILIINGVINNAGYFPMNAHPLVQNLFNGPNAIFPIVPWFAFMFSGAAIGAFLSSQTVRYKSRKFVTLLLVIGIFLSAGMNHLLYFVDLFFLSYAVNTEFLTASHLLQKMGVVVMILAGLICADKFLVLRKESVFLKIGQNTLLIYLLHSVILYGSFTGLGLDQFITNSLTVEYAIMGAVVFVFFFVIVIVVKERLQWVKQSR